MFSQSDDWDFYETEVANHATDGRNSLRSGLKELEEKGYIQRERVRNEKGQLMSSNWLLSDKPMSQKPMSQKPMYDYRTLDSSTLSNTNLSNTNLSNTNNKKSPRILGENTSIVSDNDEKKDVVVGKQTLQSNNKVTESNDINSTKLDNVSAYQKVLRYYEESGYGLASPIITQKMNYELQDFVSAGSKFEAAADIICKAMEIGALNNAKTFSYVLKITKGWLEHNLTTLEQVEAYINRPKYSKNNYGRVAKVEPKLDKQPQQEEFNMTKEEREQWIKNNI